MQQNKKLEQPNHASVQALLAALLVCAAMIPNVDILHGQSSRARETASKNSADVNPSAKVMAEDSFGALSTVPFQAGEKLNYRLIWSIFSNAAAVQLSVVERRDLFGTPTWHFRASAHSQIPLRSLAVVDDQFDSYAETATLESRQYETYLDELGEKQNTVSQLASTRQPRKNHGSVVLVEPHTRDPLAALYALRAVDWQRTVEFHAPMYDGEDVYEMSARADALADVITVAGREMKATKVSVHLFRGGQESRTKCSIWLSQDAARIPLLIEGEVPYGNVRAELVSKAE
jgi:hypothetical protein